MSELYRISNDEWLLVLKKYIGEGRGLLPVTIDEPMLGLATTRQLIEELTTRIEMDGMLDYRTVDAASGGDDE